MFYAEGASHGKQIKFRNLISHFIPHHFKGTPLLSWRLFPFHLFYFSISFICSCVLFTLLILWLRKFSSNLCWEYLRYLYPWMEFWWYLIMTIKLRVLKIYLIFKYFSIYLYSFFKWEGGVWFLGYISIYPRLYPEAYPKMFSLAYWKIFSKGGVEPQNPPLNTPLALP